MIRPDNKKAYVMVEVLFASALAVILIGSTLGAFIFAKQVFETSIVAANLQRDANVIMKRIIKGASESGNIVRLSEAVTYDVESISELHFVGTDGIERWYCLDGTGTSVLYHHPVGGSAQDEVIYTAAPGTTLTLRFWIPSGSIFTNIAVGIDVAVSQSVLGKNISGSVTTMVNIRNHSA